VCSRDAADVRATSLGLGIAAALGLWVLGSIFDLNGQQWGWWRSAAYAESGLVLLAASLRATSRVPLPRSRPPAVVAGAFVGAALVALSVVVMARHYSDPYSGPLFWPHALAVIAFVGLTLVLVGVAAGRP
jgi:hypothetical protein